MLRKGPSAPKKGGDGPKGEKGVRFTNPNKANAMDTLAGDAMENGVENAAQTATAAGIELQQELLLLMQIMKKQITMAYM